MNLLSRIGTSVLTGSMALAAAAPALAQSGDRALVYVGACDWCTDPPEFTQFEAALLNAGAEGVDVDRSQGLPSSLTSYRLIVVYGPSAGLSTEEAALEAFYQAGGTLLAVGEASGGAHTDSNPPVDALAAALGLGVRIHQDGLGAYCAHEALPVDHPLMDGVTSIWFAYASQVDGGTPLAVYSSSYPILAVEDRFVLSGDSALVSDGCLDSGYPLDGGHNDVFFKNLWNIGDMPVCGNGTQQSGEACDDGNTEDGDYCSADCSTVTGECGDEVVQSNEECDPGEGNFSRDPGACGSDCTINDGSGGAGGMGGIAGLGASGGAAGTLAGAGGEAGDSEQAGAAGASGSAGVAGDTSVAGGRGDTGGAGATGGSGGSGAVGGSGGRGGSAATGGSGGSGGSGATGGRGGSGASGAGATDASGGDDTGGRTGASGAAGAAGDTGVGASRGSGTMDGGCACRVGGRGENAGGLRALLLALGAALALTRRRGGRTR